MTAPGNDRWHQVRNVFDELVDLPPSEQTRRLAELAQSDPALHDAIAALIGSESGSDRRLQANPDINFTGRIIGNFEIVEPLATGGMGVVYKARDIQLNRTIAIKFPLPEYRTDPSVNKRFLREARAVALLDHRNVCRIYKAGQTEDGLLFLAMPLYEGETLKSLIQRSGALPVSQALDIARQVAEGLACAHAAGIIHRDLKPGNLMLLPDGTVKILDFGIAKVSGLTQTISLSRFGTVGYMSPEHIREQPVDPRSDLWALGVVLFEMLTAQRPFRGDHEVSVAHSVLHDDADFPAAKDGPIPRSVQRLTLTLLEKDLCDRYASAEEVAADIAAVERGESPPPRQAFRRRAIRRLIPRSRRGKFAAMIGAGVILSLAGGAAGMRGFGAQRASSTLPTANAKAYDLYLRGRDFQVRDTSLSSLQAAQTLYERSLELDPAFALAHARLAELHAYRYSIGFDRTPARRQAARREAETALRLKPNLPEAHFAMGQYFSAAEQHEQALVEFEAARRGLPDNSAVVAAMGKSYRNLNRWDEAIGAFKRALELDPQDLGSATLLALATGRLRRYEDGIPYWKMVIAGRPPAYDAQIILGHLYVRWTGNADTLAAVTKRLPRSVDPNGMRTFAAVFAAHMRRKPGEALAALDAASVDVSEDQLLYRPLVLQRAQAYADAGERQMAATLFDSARVMLERKVSEVPGDPRLHVALGLAYAGLGRRAEAVAHANQAMAHAPESANIGRATASMGGAAEVFAIAGATDEALKVLDRLLSLPAGREASVPMLRADPTYDPLRSDPRFETMLRKYEAR